MLSLPLIKKSMSPKNEYSSLVDTTNYLLLFNNCIDYFVIQYLLSMIVSNVGTQMVSLFFYSPHSLTLYFSLRAHPPC